ncbi:MAG: hypothetical protein ACO35B_06430 [Luminiphilus sp.]
MMELMIDPTKLNNDTTYHKSGNGAFRLTVHTDGSVSAERHEGGKPVKFKTAQDAYDWYREIHAVSGDHASWNICYHLEDHIH